MNLAFLRPLYERPGPWVSVYVDASRDSHDAAKAIDLRWEHLRDRLAAQGAPAGDLEAVGRAIAGDRSDPGPHGLAVLANGGSAVLAERIDDPPVHDTATLALLPHAMPLAVRRGANVPWLRIVVDRTGADLLEVTSGETGTAYTVEGGEDYPLSKTKPGGWSAPRYQRAAEETWDRNAGDVAEEVTRLVERRGAEVLVLAGDVRARQLLKERLPKGVAEKVVETEAGSRAAGADPEPLDEAAFAALAEHTDRRREDVVDRFQAGAGRDGVTGLTSVVAALRQARVDTLLLEDDPTSTEHLWVGDAPTQLAFTREELLAEGVAEPERVRADAAIARALAETDADLVAVTGDDVAMADGIGALLRY